MKKIIIATVIVWLLVSVVIYMAVNDFKRANEEKPFVERIGETVKAIEKDFDKGYNKYDSTNDTGAN